MIRSTVALDFGAILCLPFVALGFNTLGQMARQRRPFLSAPALGALALAVLVSLFAITTNRYYTGSGSAASFGIAANTSLTPATLLEAAEKQGVQLPRMVNVARDGGYLLLARPEQPVYADTRGSLYGGAYFDQLYRSLTGQPPADGEEPLPPPGDAILLNATWNGARAALLNFVTRDDWGIAYFDGASILVLRKTEENMPLLQNAAFAREGLAAIQQDYQRYQLALKNKVMRPANPARLIGAAATYQVLGRYEESLAILKLLTAGSPRNAGALVNRGIAELSLGQVEPAVATLAASVELLPGNALAWLWLQRAYLATGNEEAAREAEARGRELNPALAERFAADLKARQPKD
jgi:tetratricopeptide (TPR) repeat protein